METDLKPAHCIKQLVGPAVGTWKSEPCGLREGNGSEPTEVYAFLKFFK